MSTSWRVALLCAFASVVAVACSTPGYEYYLDKDETHWKVYSVSATIRSDGTCNFAVDGDDALSYSSLYWTDPVDPRATNTELKWWDAVDLDTIDTYFRAAGICEDSYRASVSDVKNLVRNHPDKYLKHIMQPSMYLTVYAPKNINTPLLERGLSLDVMPAHSLKQGDNPPGVYFSINNPQSVRRSLSPICNRQELSSLKGSAELMSEPDGTIVLMISALAYVEKNCF